MQKVSKFFLAVVFSICLTGLFAQNLDLPKNIVLKYTVDYSTYEPYVATTVKWIESTPLDQDKGKHDEAYSFLVKWVNGAPNVHVVLEPDFINLKQKKNYSLIALYMGEWSLYELKNGDKSSQEKAALQAIRAVIKIYKKGNGLVKDKTIEKLIALEDKGQLEKFVTEKLPKKK